MENLIPVERVQHEQKIEGLTTDVQKIFELIQPLLDGPMKKMDQLGLSDGKKFLCFSA